MKRIEYNPSDTEELVSDFRRLAESLRDDADFVRLVSASGEISDDCAGDIKRTLEGAALSAEETAGFLVKLSEECESTEERAALMVRKALFEHRGSIIVEKSKTPVKGSLLSGKSIKHDDALAVIALKEMSGAVK